VSWFENGNLLLSCVGFLLHCFDFPKATKVIYCINSLVFFMVTVKIYTFSHNIGPKLVMIKNMVSIDDDC